MKDRKRRNRRGFTVIELSVVLVLIAIVATMTVSFSVLIGKYVTKTNSNYRFYEQCAELRQTLSDLLLSEDATGNTCQVAESTLTGNGFSVSFEGDTLTVTRNGVEETLEFGEIGKISFETGVSEQAVKCTAVQSGEEEDGNVQTFLITLRCGTFQTAAD